MLLYISTISLLILKYSNKMLVICNIRNVVRSIILNFITFLFFLTKVNLFIIKQHMHIAIVNIFIQWITIFLPPYFSYEQYIVTYIYAGYISANCISTNSFFIQISFLYLFFKKEFSVFLINILNSLPLFNSLSTFK